MDAAKLTDWLSYAGVLVASLGVIATAPMGARRLAFKFRRSIQRGWRWVRIQVFRRRKSVTLNIHPAVARAVGGSHAVLTTRKAWQTDWSDREKIAALRERLDVTERDINQLRQDLTSERTSRGESIRQLEKNLQRQGSELASAFERHREVAHTLDERGLPVILAGIALTAIPDKIASLPWPITWLILASVPIWALRAAVIALKATRPAGKAAS